MRIKPQLLTLASVCLALALATAAEADSITYVIQNFNEDYVPYSSGSPTFTGDGYLSSHYYYGVDKVPDPDVVHGPTYDYTPYFIAYRYYRDNASYYRNIIYDTSMQVGISDLAGSDIISAILSFNFDYVIDYYDTDINLVFSSFDSNGTLGWALSPPGGGLGSVNLTLAQNQTGPSSVDVTALLQNQVDASEAYFAMHMETTNQSASEWAYTYAPASTDYAQVRLTVEYDSPIPNSVPVPEPASIVLLGSFLGGMATVRRFRKR